MSLLLASFEVAEALLEVVDAVDAVDDDGGALWVDAEVALEAHELGDAEGDVAVEGTLLFIGVGSMTPRSTKGYLP